MNTNNNFKFGNGNKSKLFDNCDDNKYDYNIEEFNFDPKRKNDSHVAIINLIKENSVILDIGCATGLIEKVLVNSKNVTIDGIEYDKDAYEICKNSNLFRKIYNFSITDNSSKEYKEFLKQNNKYDYIIFADVLEHLVDPWVALINVYDLLKDEGQIVISLPNINHIDIIKGLINGIFNYNSLGLLDTTHVRFFTFQSFCDLLKNIGKNAHIYYDVELKEKILAIPEYVTTADDYQLFNLNNYLEGYFVLQNILLLTKSKNEKVNIKKWENPNDELFDKMLDSFKIASANKLKLDVANTTILKLSDEQKSRELEIKNLKIKNSNMKLENNNLKREVIKLQDSVYYEINKNKENENNVMRLLNSKRWKLFNKICNFINFFRIKRK